LSDLEETENEFGSANPKRDPGLAPDGLLDDGLLDEANEIRDTGPI
jgi:hypothetical protein